MHSVENGGRELCEPPSDQSIQVGRRYALVATRAVCDDAPMTEQSPRGRSFASTSWRELWRSSSSWIIAVAVVVVLAFVGALLIGLSPVYTVGLVVCVVAASFVWMRFTTGRTDGAVSAVGAVGRVAATCLVVLLVVQVVPLGRDHSNPVVVGEPDWDSPRTRELTVRACYSCHSNEVEWPWYSNVAPVSWAVAEHVDKGRDALNFSEFTIDRGDAEEAIEEILHGSMPPAYYTRFGLHSDAKLSESEQADLVAGLRATPGFAED
jgi:hypothetical protein